MPFDGIVVKCVVKELSDILPGSRIEKIFQPEADEIIINIRAKNQNFKLLLSASANYPRIHVTESSRVNPAIAPVFCMLLRKHLSGGRIIGVEFHDYERIITLLIESVNELGDLTLKKLIIEIMGRHSNIILTTSEDKILDSIKHVDSDVSSVREVMPARPYVLPPAQDKQSPDTLDMDKLLEDAESCADTNVEGYLLSKIKGFSPLLCREICFRSGVSAKKLLSVTSRSEVEQLKKVIKELAAKIIDCDFSPCIVYGDEAQRAPADFHCLPMLQYEYTRQLPSISSVLDLFYCEKDRSERLKQKKSDVLKVLNNSLDRCRKKMALQQEKLREVADREKLKLWGELITANIYCIPKSVKKVSLLNYYSESGEHIDIVLDENRSPQDNAQRYYKKYAKAKSAFTNTNRQYEESTKELDYLESVLHLLENCTSLQEIDEVRQELMDQGYLLSKKKGHSSKQLKASAPFHFTSTDGLDIYVGKNNKQNDLLTLKLSSSNDVWLHTRNIPGSHVIIKKYQQPIPDSTLLEAAILAAYHSKAKMSSNVPVDYTTVKNVKKPSGAKPGMVIYESFKTIIATPDEEIVNKLKK